jgi:YesN/AraC family two-component response regulator
MSICFGVHWGKYETIPQIQKFYTADAILSGYSCNLSFRQLSPIRQLLEAVQSLSGNPETTAVAGELKKLEVVFHTLIEEHSDYARTLEHQREVLLEIFLLRIIYNGYTDEQDIRDFGLHATFKRIVDYNADLKEPVSLRLNYSEAGMTEEKIGYVIHAYMNLAKSYRSESQSDNREDQIVAYLAANYRDQQLSLNTLSYTFSVSNNYLSKLFKRKTGMRFSDYLEKLRMQEAYRLLRSGGKTIKEIASETGYASDQSFRRAFKKVHGFTPSELRADS